MILTIPIPEKVSLNSIYSGVHFSKRSSHKEHYWLAVRTTNPQPFPGPFPVHCHYHFRLRGSRLDISNHAYMLKMVEDALVACGVLPDDTQKYVSMISVTAELVPKTAENEVVVHISSSTDAK